MVYKAIFPFDPKKLCNSETALRQIIKDTNTKEFPSSY